MYKKLMINSNNINPKEFNFFGELRKENFFNILK